MTPDEQVSSEQASSAVAKILNNSPSKRRQPVLFGLAIGLLCVLAVLVYRQRDVWVAVIKNPGSLVHELHAQERSRLGEIRPTSEGFLPVTVIQRSFPPITEVPIATAAEADAKLQGSELVLGIVVGDRARAYPINMLTGPQREIINDTLGDVPIAATW